MRGSGLMTGSERRLPQRLHEDDVKLMVKTIRESISLAHPCRFPDIQPQEMSDLRSVLPFMKAFKGLMEKTGIAVWLAAVLGVMGFIGLLVKIALKIKGE
jgi:hypothetical protein